MTTSETHTDGAIEGTGGFVAAWLKQGDEMYSGGNVPAGLVGLRLHGTDTELLGSPAEWGELSDRVADRWVSPRVDAVNDFADRLAPLVEQHGGFSSLARVFACGDVEALARMLALFGHHTQAYDLVDAHVLAGEAVCDQARHADLRLIGAACEAIEPKPADGHLIEANYAPLNTAVEAYVQDLAA